MGILTHQDQNVGVRQRIKMPQQAIGGYEPLFCCPLHIKQGGKLKDFCGTMQNGDGQTQGKKS